MPDSKSKAILHEPHDALVRWAFSQCEHGAGLLEASLPSELTRACDWGTLRTERDSFVSKELRKRHSDLIFSVVAAGQPLLVYVLLEHQRKVDALMVLRMLVYMTRLWEQYVRDNPRAKVLPVVIPLLLHHSKTGWTAATAFEDVIGVDAAVRAVLEQHIPRFEMRLIDVSPGHATELANEAMTELGVLVLWLMSVAGDDERLEREILRMNKMLKNALKKDAKDAYFMVVDYLSATHRRMGDEKIRRLIEEAVGPEGREIIMTFREEIKLEGRREGKLEGEVEGMRKLMLGQLAARFGRVPARIQARIRAADEAALGRWSVRLLTAASCAEVIDDDAEGPGGARGGTKRTTVANRRGAAKRA